MTDYGCKVCRVLADRGMDEYDEQMVREWRGDGGDRSGYRTLASELNVELLRTEMARAGLETRGSEPRSKYDRLTGSDADIAEQIRAMLSENGVPITALERDFVSYGVVRTHLKECLGAEREEQSETEWPRDAVEYAMRLATEKTTDAVRASYNRGDLRTGAMPSVSVSIEVVCPVCEARRDVMSALDAGAICQCVAAADQPDRRSTRSK